jgi:hypothetical protein
LTRLTASGHRRPRWHRRRSRAVPTGGRWWSQSFEGIEQRVVIVVAVWRSRRADSGRERSRCGG